MTETVNPPEMSAVAINCPPSGQKTLTHGLPRWRPISLLLACITVEKTKFDHLVSSLSPDAATEVHDLILAPPGDTPYSRLKAWQPLSRGLLGPTSRSCSVSSTTLSLVTASPPSSSAACNSFGVETMMSSFVSYFYNTFQAKSA